MKATLIKLHKKVKRSPFGLNINFKTDNSLLLEVEVTNIKIHDSGEITSLLRATSYIAQRNVTQFYIVSYNRPRSYATFRKELEKDLGLNLIKSQCDIPEVIRQEVYSYLQSLDYVEELSYKDNFKPPKWMIEPLIYKGRSTLLYAPKASGKTLLGCIISANLENPEISYPFNKQKARVLYLDWEGSKDEFGYKLVKVFDYYKRQGINFSPSFPLYRRCIQRFAKDIYFIRRIIYEKKVDFIIIDSLVPAVGGVTNDAKVAGEFFEVANALNSQGISFLIFTHVAKSNIESDNSDYTWIGSVMFGNYARSVWALKTDRIDNKLFITLSCRYNNIDAVKPPFDVTIEFGNSASDIQEIQYNLETARVDLLPVAQQVKHYLKDGAKSIDQLAEEIYGGNPDSGKIQYIRNLLNRMKKRNEVVKLKNSKWGLITDDVPF